jgi:hypothetical protein
LADTVTARHLELICNARNPASDVHLFGALDHTCSNAGCKKKYDHLVDKQCSMGRKIVALKVANEQRHDDQQIVIKNIFVLNYIARLLRSELLQPPLGFESFFLIP